jgi:prevent-host-death family protein
MAKVLAQRELRNHNAQVIDAVAAGESFIVTRNGEPVAELRPAKHVRRTFISRDEIAESELPGREINRHQFRADLDRVVDQSI